VIKRQKNRQFIEPVAKLFEHDGIAGKTAAPDNTANPTFTITFNPGIVGQTKKYECTVLDNTQWLEGTTAVMQFNNDVNLFQTNDSTNNPNNDSQPFIQSSNPVKPYCQLIAQ
jgi:hypothetical protein